MFFDTKSSAFEIESLPAGFGARIHGLDLSQALSPEVVASIQQAIDHFAVLVFAQQMLDEKVSIPIIITSSIAKAGQEIFNIDIPNVRSVMQKPVDLAKLSALVGRVLSK